MSDPAAGLALRTSVGAVTIPRDVVVATGPEAETYLQGQLSQDVAALAVGRSARALVLQPQGKVVAWLRVTRTADEAFLLDTDAGWGGELLARLQRFKLRTKVELEPATWSCVALRGPGADALAAGLDLAALGALAVVPAGWPGTPGVDLLGPAVDVPSGAEPVPNAAYEALRIESGVPAMGAEATAATIPAELGTWLIDASVSFTKGCYTGQELVARIDSRGSQVPRPVRGLVFVGADVPPSGATLRASAESGAKELGHVTSAAWSSGLGAPVGLCIVGRAVEVGSEVVASWDGGEATALVEDLPLVAPA
jgi:folate-binding protein YgfZ